MEERGWVTKNMHGSVYQAGFPDVFAVHPQFGVRLIEVKMPWGKYTLDQEREFHRLSAGGARIWTLVIKWPLDNVQILLQYNMILKNPPNWTHYIGK